jgi:arginine decarboxylase
VKTGSFFKGEPGVREIPIFQPCPDDRKMPLVAALLRFAGSNRTSWHMPGHGGGQAWPSWLKSALTEIDVTELPQTDDLNQPAGPALQAMDLAAAAFGAGVTRFITSGSTSALQIMLALCVGRGGRLLLPRAVHQSAAHAAALLNLDLCWLNAQSLPSGLAGFGLLPLPTPADVENALCRHPDCRAVLLTAPDYYGFCPDLAAIARITHRYGALLLVDEAHGAHLSFGAGLLPVDAMGAGADACVQSGHKTLPVLTPGAFLHLSAGALAEGRVSAAELDRMIPVFQTSSPSFPIAATLDYARAWLTECGHMAIRRQLEFLADFSATMPDGLFCSSVSARPDPDTAIWRDPLRLVLACRPEAPYQTAQALDKGLAAAGIDIEFADLNRLVLLPGLQQPAEAWRRLSDALRHLDESGVCLFTRPNDRIALEDEWRILLAGLPEAALLPGDALFGRHRLRQVPLAQSAGLISARSILPYPPGIPLIWPGERLDKNRVDFLRRLSENNISIAGIDQDNLWVLA